ncbi:MAG: YraN family protein [Bacteroidales bacterium]|nr:YraN family protein [Bacteroidales bacterium]
MAEHNELGKLGEKLAKDFLAAKGYQILEQNWVCGHKEIDIIALDGKELVIVEVKTRRVMCLVDPEETVDKYKQRFLIWAAEAYIERNNLDVDVRFDIVAIVIDKNNEHRIDHIENAFYPMLSR